MKVLNGQNIYDCGDSHAQCNVENAVNECKLRYGSYSYRCEFSCNDDYHETKDGTRCEPDFGSVSDCGSTHQVCEIENAINTCEYNDLSNDYDCYYECNDGFHYGRNAPCDEDTDTDCGNDHDDCSDYWSRRKCIGGECVYFECEENEILCDSIDVNKEKYRTCVNGRWSDSVEHSYTDDAQCLRTDVNVFCTIPSEWPYSCGNNGFVEVTCNRETGKIEQNKCLGRSCLKSNTVRCIHEGENIVLEGGTVDEDRCLTASYKQSCSEDASYSLWCKDNVLQKTDCSPDELCIMRNRQARCLDIETDCNSNNLDSVYCSYDEVYVCTSSGLKLEYTNGACNQCGLKKSGFSESCLDYAENLCMVADYVPHCDGTTGYYCKPDSYGTGTIKTKTCNTRCDVRDSDPWLYPHGEIACDGE